MTKLWVRSTWKDAAECGVKIQDGTRAVPVSFSGASSSMEQFDIHCLQADEAFKQNVMWCREFLQVTHLSEITTPDGRHIIGQNWMGEEPFRDQEYITICIIVQITI